VQKVLKKRRQKNIFYKTSFKNKVYELYERLLQL